MQQQFRRNDFCHCGSGKKYKRCCFDSDGLKQGSTSSDHRQEPILSLVEMTVTGDPLKIEDGRDSVPSVDQAELADIYRQMKEVPENREALMLIQRLIVLRAKYRHHPVILNYLATTYSIAGQQDRAYLTLVELVTEFPRYLFGRIMLAQRYLQQEEYEKAFEVMGKQYLLKTLYPERDVFHMSEARGFHSVVFWCCFHLDDIRSAYHQYKLLKGLHEEFEHGCPRTAERTGFADIERALFASGGPLIRIASNNCHRDVEELRKSGAIILEEASEQPWGISAMCQDLYGNLVYVCQEKGQPCK